MCFEVYESSILKTKMNISFYLRVSPLDANDGSISSLLVVAYMEYCVRFTMLLLSSIIILSSELKQKASLKIFVRFFNFLDN
jgi:hypothetical protein